MAIGIETNSVDLDSILAPLVSGRTPAAATGIKKNGTDLNALYDSIVNGVGPAATQIKKAGTDLALIFCALGKNLLATLPAFPGAFTSTPQSGSMTVTISGGVGPFTYHWTATGDGTTTGTINSGQGTPTINWTAHGTPAEPGILDWDCLVTDTFNGYTATGHTHMNFNVP